MNPANIHRDNMDGIREKLENSIKNSSVDIWFDGECCFFDITQTNQETGNKSTWAFCVDFGTSKVIMFEPVEKEDWFENDNEVFEIIKSFLHGGNGHSKKIRSCIDYGKSIKGHKINSSRKPIKSSTDNHLKEYVSSDSFAESGAFQDYIMDKLSQKGFSSEEIEYGWYDSPVKEAREEIEKNYNIDDYVNWAKDYITKDKYKMMWYKDWLMRKGYPVEEEPLMKRHSFDPANNTWSGPSANTL